MSKKGSITSASTNQSYSDRPIKSILKKSFNNRTPQSGRELKFDEENVRATFHPIDKDYGHDVVDEPDTPFPTQEELDAKLLSEKLVQLKAEEEENEEKQEQHDEFLRRRAEMYRSEFKSSKDVAQKEEDDESDRHKKFRNKRYLMASAEYKTAKKLGQNIDKEENENNE